MQARTKRQRQVLDYITSFIEDRGYEPSYQQIARHFDIASKSAIAKHVAALENQGLLSRHRENGSFGISLKPKDLMIDSVREVRWLDVSRDATTETAPLFVPKFMVEFSVTERIFALRVRDDSMLQVNILAADIVLIERRSYARDGDIVAASIPGDRIVVNKYFRNGANIELRPENEKYTSINLPADRISIHGVVRGLLRLIS